MKLNTLNEMFRCEHACCKNFAAKEILIGGFKKSISLCSNHFLELKELIREDTKASREKVKSEILKKVNIENER